MSSIKMDVSDKLTVFVISCGTNPNYTACMQALSGQSVKFQIKEIKDIFPLSLAFQRMLDLCETRYYIEVDEDMILDAGTVEHMLNFMIDCEKRDSSISMCTFRLQDVHTGIDIYGVKIYRHDILKCYPYNLDHPSCEVEQIARFEKDGYKNFLSTKVVGQHSPLWNKELIYDRYRNLMRKFNIYHYQWLEQIPEMLVNKLKKEFSLINVYALLGAYQGIMDGELVEEKNYVDKSKNYMKFLPYTVRPEQATLYVTSNCNYKCNFCIRQHVGIESAPDLTVDIVGDLLFKFPSIKGICICGFGEPLLSSNLVPILQYLRDKNIFTGLITNGSLLKKRYDELKEQSIGYISVSLNSYCREKHMEISKTDTWDDVIDGIKLVLAHKKFDLYVSYVLTQKNLDDVEYVLDLMKRLGVKAVHFHNILPHFDVNENGKFWDLVLTDEYEEKLEHIKKLDKDGIVKRWPVLIDRNGGRMACRFLHETIQVNGNGSVGLCNSVIPCNKIFGNIKDYVVWNNAGLSKFREDYANKKIPQCAMCFRNWYSY